MIMQRQSTVTQKLWAKASLEHVAADLGVRCARIFVHVRLEPVLHLATFTSRSFLQLSCQLNIAPIILMILYTTITSYMFGGCRTYVFDATQDFQQHLEDIERHSIAGSFSRRCQLL